MANLKSIIIFVSIGVVLILVYVFLIKGDGETENLVYDDPLSATGVTDGTSDLSSDFLFLLLNIKNIKLDDTIFSDEAFANLRDSSITLTPDGTEGRPNPFAPIGSDISATPATPLLSTEDATFEGVSSDPIVPPANPAPTTPRPPTPTGGSSNPSVNPLIL